MTKLIKACNKLINENEVHIHNYHKGYGGPSSSDSSDSSSSAGSSSQSDQSGSQQNSSTNASNSSHPSGQGQTQTQGQGLAKQTANQQATKFMASSSPKKTADTKNKKDMKDFKEVFIKNHVRRYRRKPSIGLMKQTFGVTT